MKKAILGFVTALVLVTLFSFSAMTDKGNAKPTMKQGVYLYVYSQPIQEYEVLGSKKTTVTMSGKPEQLISAALKKIKKDDALKGTEGIIFNESLDEYDFIKFK